MNFFERQADGRRNSKILLLLFALAVAGIVLAVDVAAVLTWLTWKGLLLKPPAGFWAKIGHASLGVHVPAVLATLGIIGYTSLSRMRELRQDGGAGIARMMGARAVQRGTQDPLERRLLNVVDEMAIASGTRVPDVYVMDSQNGINAFAAGYDNTHCAIVVTRGTLESLSRSELQGVIGHEFSHIVNGDMALNLHIVGILAGIVFIGAGGELMMRLAYGSKEKNAAPFMLLGFALWVIGSIGVLASRIIKAVLSRQREYLADACSVQFTRNPEGLAGALDQVRQGGSIVANRHSEEISHLFFANGRGLLAEPILATHPPVEKRIQRIAPSFRGEDYRARRAALREAEAAMVRDAAPRTARKVEMPWSFSPAEAIALVGTVQQQHLVEAQAFLAALPTSLREALGRWPAAGGAVAALMLSRDAGAADAQVSAVASSAPAGMAEALRDALPWVRDVAPEMQLAVVDLALPTLRKLGPEERGAFVRTLDALLVATGGVSLYRFAFVTFLRSQLEAPRLTAAQSSKTLAQLRDAAVLMMSLVSHAGCASSADADADFVRAFNVGMIESGLVGQAGATPREQCTPERASAALEQLRELAPLQKARLVKGLFAAITADGVIRPVEAALMRMVGGVLDCPLPPLTVPISGPHASVSQPLATASA